MKNLPENDCRSQENQFRDRDWGLQWVFRITTPIVIKVNDDFINYRVYTIFTFVQKTF